jgi:hypothetical protein
LKAAELLWTDRIQNPITSLDLPWLRSSSDIAWGFWNRATVRKLQLKNIHYLMACDIVNEETLEIIKRALKKHKELQPPSEHPEDPDSDKGDGVKNWPGTTFILNGDDLGMALLGMAAILQLLFLESKLTMILHRLPEWRWCRLLSRATQGAAGRQQGHL